jgi:hypothetical protein
VRFSRAFLYSTLAVVAAVAYGIGVGRYWLADMVVLTVVASAVAYLCFARRTKTTSIEHDYRTLGGVGRPADRPLKVDDADMEPGKREHVSRSRIAHYVTVSRIKSTALAAWLRRESDSPFERALLNESGWRKLSGESLEEITRKAFDASASSVQH